MNGIIKEEDYEKVIDLVKNTNLPLTHIAKYFGAKSTDPIKRILKLNNVSIEGRRSFKKNYIDKDIVDKIKKMYCDDMMSKRKISENLNIPISTINPILKDLNISTRNHYSQVFNENYFDEINTPNKAYLLGFLYADGCVNKNNVLSFTLHNKDREILEMYKKELNATNEITTIVTRNNQEHCRISFCSKHMCDSLINYGCGHNKTFNLDFPNINDNFIWHFIRGFMDGDGCIHLLNRENKHGIMHKYIGLSFTGTESMMNSLKNIFKVDSNILFYRNAYSIKINKYEDVLRILKLIYNDAELFLSRKHARYVEYIDFLKGKNNNE